MIYKGKALGSRGKVRVSQNPEPLRGANFEQMEKEKTILKKDGNRKKVVIHGTKNCLFTSLSI